MPMMFSASSITTTMEPYNYGSWSTEQLDFEPGEPKDSEQDPNPLWYNPDVGLDELVAMEKATRKPY